MNVNPVEFIGEHPQLLQRYDQEQRKFIFKYWNLIRWTRRNGKVAENIILAELEYWKNFKVEEVLKSIQIHMETPTYQKLRENYTRGILRNVSASGGIEATPPEKKTNKNKFHNFESKLNKLSETELEEIAKRRIEKMKAEG